MNKITQLKDIETYKQALSLAQQIFILVKNRSIAQEFFLVDQLKRASLSVAANIAERFGRNTKKDFAQFLSISLGSVNELVTFLDFISLQYKIDTSLLKHEYELLGRRIYSFRKYLLTTYNS